MTERAHRKQTEVPADRVPEVAPYTSRFVEAGKLKLHYLDYGTEGLAPMLCVHGGAAHAHWFDYVAPGFTSDFHVRAVDLRGHGDSDWADPPVYSFEKYASDLDEVVQKLDLRDFVLIGHSMGGMVSLVYAATHPGRVSRLVLVDTTMHMSKESIGRLRDLGARPAKDYATHDQLISRYRLQPEGPKLAACEVIRHVAAHSGRQTPEGTWRHKFDRSLYAIFERLDGRPYWNHIKIPALLVKGEYSSRVNAEILAEVKARSPRVELVEVPNSDHHVTLDNPPGFADAVRAWLGRTG
ncbi:MAG: alpha/beta fold hydrolase [Burkholderiales bacterium]